MEATHKISAVYFNDGLFEATWEDIQTHEVAVLSCYVSKEVGEKIASVVPACVYIKAASKASAQQA